MIQECDRFFFSCWLCCWNLLTIFSWVSVDQACFFRSIGVIIFLLFPRVRLYQIQSRSCFFLPFLNEFDHVSDKFLLRLLHESCYWLSFRDLLVTDYIRWYEQHLCVLFFYSYAAPSSHSFWVFLIYSDSWLPFSCYARARSSWFVCLVGICGVWACWQCEVLEVFLVTRAHRLYSEGLHSTFFCISEYHLTYILFFTAVAVVLNSHIPRHLQIRISIVAVPR